MPSQPPVLPGYSYVRPLGGGGFADVFLFEKDMPRRLVAVKVLLAPVLDEAVLRAFNAEADVMAKVSSHPAIVTIFEASIAADGRPYLVMEYCETSYGARYRTEILSLQEILGVGVRIAAALESVHRAGVLHRDVKPSNILLTPYGTPVLSDFGIATAPALAEDSEHIAMSVPWSAPEVVQERSAGSIAAEVWSLGATLYSLTAGRSPAERPDKADNKNDAIRERVIRARYHPTQRADVPQSLEALLEHTMRKDPQLRPVSALAVAEALQAIETELGLTPTPLELPRESWTLGSAEVDFDNTGVYGPPRSRVEYDSARPARSGSRDGSRSSAARRRTRAPAGYSVRTVVIVALIASAVTAALVAGLFLIGG